MRFSVFVATQAKRRHGADVPIFLADFPRLPLQTDVMIGTSKGGLCGLPFRFMSRIHLSV
jgi:hypothetical protein